MSENAKPAAAPVPAVAVAKDASVANKGRARVVVGCKLPNGLVLQNYHRPEGVDTHQPVGDPVTLNGGFSSKVIGGYGMTEVDAEFMDKWMADNKAFPLVVSGALFVQGSHDKAGDHATDNAHVVTGLEPINQRDLGPKISPDGISGT